MTWPFKRRPPVKFTHPCPVCQHHGSVFEHRGQHAVVYPPAPKAAK